MGLFLKKGPLVSDQPPRQLAVLRGAPLAKRRQLDKLRGPLLARWQDRGPAVTAAGQEGSRFNPALCPQL